MLAVAIAVVLCVMLTGLVVDRSLLSPTVIFGGIWTLSLLAIALSGQMWFRPTDMALFVYALGAFAFVFGSMLVPREASAPGRTAAVAPPGESNRASQLMLWGFVIVTAATLPLFFQKVLALADGGGFLGTLATLRRAALEGEGGPLSGGLMGNLIVLSQFVAVACYYERDGSWPGETRAVVAILLALVLGSLGGSKANAVTLVLTIFFVDGLKHGRVRLRSVAVAVTLVLALFAVGLWAVNLGGAGQADMRSLTGVVGTMILNYWVGGIVAFSEVVDGVLGFEAHHTTARFFLETARSLGWAVDVPSLHAPYTMIGPGQDSNTYTIYFSYFLDGGFPGVILAMMLVGAGTTAFWQAAMRGGRILRIMYAVLCVSLVLSVSAEHFALALNKLGKAGAFLLVLYGLPRLASAK